MRRNYTRTRTRESDPASVVFLGCILVFFAAITVWIASQKEEISVGEDENSGVHPLQQELLPAGSQESEEISGGEDENQGFQPLQQELLPAGSID